MKFVDTCTITNNKSHKVTLKLLCQVFFSVKSSQFWFIVVLNTLLVVIKWVDTLIMVTLPSTGAEETEGLFCSSIIV
jgi:hypothetical protein